MPRSSDDVLKLSPSSINAILDCPRCGWRKFKGLERPRGIMSTLPNAMDKILKAHLDEYRGKGEWPPMLKGKVPGRPTLEPLRSRVKWTDATNKIELGGLLDDAYEETDGRVGPLDLKTRGKAAVDAHPSYLRQMSLYHLLLAANGKKPTGSAVLVYFFPLEIKGDACQGLPFGVDVKQVPTSEEEALKLVAEAAKIVRGPLPEPSGTCGYCKWLGQLADFDRGILPERGRRARKGKQEPEAE